MVISPIVQFDEKFKILPLTEVYEEYSDELLGQIMEQQKEDMDKYKQTESDIKLYEKFRKSKEKNEFLKIRAARFVRDVQPE